MKENVCERCGLFLSDYTPKYRVYTQVVSDFENYIMADSENPKHNFKAGHSCETTDDSELDDDDYHEISFFLCPKCKRKFINDPLNAGKPFLGKERRFERIYH